MASRDPLSRAESWKYWAAVLVALIALPIVIFVSGFFLGGIQIDSFEFRSVYALWAFYAVYLITSCHIMSAQEWGGIFVLEHPALQVGPGFIFAPWLLTTLRRAPRTGEEEQFPADPEFIQKVPDENPLKEGEVRPIRVMTGPPDPNRPDDIMNVQMDLEVTASVIWSVSEKNFFLYWNTIPGDSWLEKRLQIRKRLRDSTENILAMIASDGPADVFIKNLRATNAQLMRELQDEVDGWNLSIDNARVQSPDVSHDVAKALTKIPQARAEGQAQVIRAHADKQAEVARSEGHAQGRERIAEARRKEIAAEGEGFRDAAKAMEVDPKDFLAATIARETLGKSTIIVGADGIAQAIGIGKTVLNSNTPTQGNA